MVRTALKFSEAKAEASASVSCARRDNCRTQRPKAMSGSIAAGMAITTMSERRGLVTNIMTMPPTSMMRLRSDCDSEEPATAFICVVSAVRRLINSPECAVSKNAGPSVDTCWKMSLRRSATTRSPSQLT